MFLNNATNDKVVLQLHRRRIPYTAPGDAAELRLVVLSGKHPLSSSGFCPLSSCVTHIATVPTTSAGQSLFSQQKQLATQFSSEVVKRPSTCQPYPVASPFPFRLIATSSIYLEYIHIYLYQKTLEQSLQNLYL